jgi:hypothetical protein
MVLQAEISGEYFNINYIHVENTNKYPVLKYRPVPYRTDSDPHKSPLKVHRPGYDLSGFYINFVLQVFGDVNISFGSGSVEPDSFIRYLENYLSNRIKIVTIYKKLLQPQ